MRVEAQYVLQMNIVQVFLKKKKKNPFFSPSIHMTYIAVQKVMAH